MDWERLSIEEMSLMAKLIRILGTPAAPDELEKLINVCEGAATMYRKAQATARAQSRNHGE